MVHQHGHGVRKTVHFTRGVSFELCFCVSIVGRLMYRQSFDRTDGVPSSHTITWKSLKCSAVQQRGIIVSSITRGVSFELVFACQLSGA